MNDSAAYQIAAAFKRTGGGVTQVGITSTIAVDVPGAALLASPYSLGGYMKILPGCNADATIRVARLIDSSA